MSYGDDGLWALGELDRVLGGFGVLASRPANPRLAGGEWDYINALPRRTRRRLIGARYMVPGGLAPDQLAEVIVDEVSGVESVDEAMRWYVRTCLAAIGEARLIAHRRRHGKLARRNGYSSYYEYRNAQAIKEGYGSLWDKRRRNGWE